MGDEGNQFSLDSSADSSVSRSNTPSKNDEEEEEDDEEDEKEEKERARLSSKGITPQKARIRERSKQMSEFVNNNLQGVETQINQINQWIRTVEGIVESGSDSEAPSDR